MVMELERKVNEIEKQVGAVSREGRKEMEEIRNEIGKRL
jgi:hypothetical protein